MVTQQHEDCLQAEASTDIRLRLQKQLLTIGVKLRSVQGQILFDSEQACEEEHKGQWKVRLAHYAQRSLTHRRP